MSLILTSFREHYGRPIGLGLIMGVLSVAVAMPAWAQNPITPPDLTVCDGVDACKAPPSFCDAEGFKITLKRFTPAPPTTGGKATYVYEICEPLAGVCSGDGITSCLDNEQCTKGNPAPGGNCTRECSTDKFHGLSHFDVAFPLLADTSCLTGNNEVTGSCACKQGSSSSCTVDSAISIGDGSCFANECVGAGTTSYTCDGSGGNKKCTGGPYNGLSCSNANQCNPGTCSETKNLCLTNGSCGPTPVAKCDNTNLNPGDCVVMTLEIAGETTDLGVGPIVVVSKDATTCEATCGAGPSCDACNEVGGSACLTRTLGFWGTHPWITNNYAYDIGDHSDPTLYSPISVCNKKLDCDDTDDGKSNPACNAGTCDSVMEGLGSTPGIEMQGNQPYVSFIKQLTAAKLNLKATAALSSPPGATCSDWSYQGKTIQDWISVCEGDGINNFGICGASKSNISSSGCIEALNAFNNSQDTGFTTTPAPFDRPSVDDHGNVSGADPSQFTLAHGNSTPPGKLVIGRNIPNGGQCLNLP